MKASCRFALWLVFAAATPLMAAFVPVKIDAENVLPEFPLVLLNEGVSEGEVVMALSIDASGKLGDSLVLAYTHKPFVRACEEALKGWKFTPARFDGEAVGVHTVLTFNFRRGAYVESNIHNINNNYLSGRFSQHMSRRLIAFAQLDRPPVPISTVNPKYALQARERGVSGSVRVRFYIDEDGVVRLPSVSSTAHPYLADLAVEALRDWRFQPGLYRGRPALVAATQDFHFGNTP